MSFDDFDNMDDDFSDWLGDLGSEDGELDQTISGSSEETPDWLKPIREKEEERRGLTSSDLSNQDQNNWLDPIREKHAEEYRPDNSGDDHTLLGEWGGYENAEEDNDDWLESLSADSFGNLGLEDDQVWDEDQINTPIAPEFSLEKARQQLPIEPGYEIDANAEIMGIEDIQLNNDLNVPIPDWINGLDGDIVDNIADVVSPVGPSTSVFVDDGFALETEKDDLPDWLKDATVDDELTPVTRVEQVEEAPKFEKTASSASKANIHEAKKSSNGMPDWLNAMRPIDNLDFEPEKDTDDSSMISLGPLAGLSHVLQAEPEISDIRKQPSSPDKLILSKSQKSQIKILQAIIDNKPMAEDSAESDGKKSSKWFSILVSILFILVSFVGLEMNSKLPSGLIPDQINQTVNSVNSLPDGSRVLVVVDYQPGLSGEMEAVASGLIQHLAIKKVKFVCTSTNPTGTGLSTRMFSNIASQNNFLSQNLNCTNIGYLSGDITGMQAFVYDASGAKPDMVLMTGIMSINDFQAILVITDDGENARAWLEQVRPLIPNLPLLLAVSAQAEPIVYPYYTSGQLDGLVSGFKTGIYYEQYLGTSYVLPISRNITGFNYLIILACIIGVVGNLVKIGSLITNRLKFKV